MTHQDTYEVVKAFREHAKQVDDQRDKGLSRHIPGVNRYDNISYGPKETWNLLDIYLPADHAGKVPTIIMIHGGGWVYGTKETYQFFGLSLAKEGFAVINFNYELAPSAIFPSQLDDVNLAMHWVAKHGADYELDLDNIFVIGDSAGGQMAMQYLTILTNNDYRSKFGYELPNLAIKAAAIHCGAAFMNRPKATQGVPAAYFTSEVLAEKADLLETEKYMTRQLPPLFLTTASHDFLRDDTIRLDGYLLAKGIDHECHSYGSAENPKKHVFNYNIKDPEAQACNQETLAFFRRYLT